MTITQASVGSPSTIGVLQTERTPCTQCVKLRDLHVFVRVLCSATADWETSVRQGRKGSSYQRFAVSALNNLGITCRLPVKVVAVTVERSGE
jgi:hypothetical protein